MPNNNQSNYRNSEQDRRLGEIEKSLKVINQEMGEIKVRIAELTSTQKIILALLLLIMGGMMKLIFF